MSLHPCPSCARHVAPAAHCPFCNASLATSKEHALPKARLGRAARMAFGAALVSVACGGSGSPGDDASAGDATNDQQASKDSGNGMDAQQMSDATMQDSGGSDAGEDAPMDSRPDNFFPPYGAPPADGLKKIV